MLTDIVVTFIGHFFLTFWYKVTFSIHIEHCFNFAALTISLYKTNWFRYLVFFHSIICFGRIRTRLKLNVIRSTKPLRLNSIKFGLHALSPYLFFFFSFVLLGNNMIMLKCFLNHFDLKLHIGAWAVAYQTFVLLRFRSRLLINFKNRWFLSGERIVHSII